MSSIEKPEGMSDEEFETALELATVLRQVAIVAFLKGRGEVGATEEEVQAAVIFTVDAVAKANGLPVDGAPYLN